MKESRNRYLLKNTAIFTLGNFASKFISFFLVPLYTNILSTSEYGTVDLVVTICTITVPIITLNIMEGVMRFNLDRGVDKNKITKIGIVILFFGALCGLILIPICSIWKAISSISVLVYFYIVCSASCQIFLSDLRGKEKLIQYSIGNILNTLLIACLNILFLLVFKLGISGYLLAYTIANAFVALYAFIIGKGYRAIKSPLDKQKMIEMVKYSVVLIPNSFMWWIMNSSDHVMVTSMIGVAANGIYAISYKLPTLISSFTGIFTQAWTYSAIRESGSEDEVEYNNRIFKANMAVAIILGMFIISISQIFLDFYVSEQYYEAWKYIPPLIIGYVFMTLGSFVGCSYVVQKDTKGILFSGCFGAVINIALNFLLINRIGIMGAAIATCTSYIGVFLYRLVDTRKYVPIKVNNKGFYVGVFLLVVSSIIIFLESGIKYIILALLFVLTLALYSPIWLPIFRNIAKRMSK